jgi:hypothetical protein
MEIENSVIEYKRADLERQMIDALNVKQYANTTIYLNDDTFILSPWVGKENHWFDIRDVNLQQDGGRKNQYLIVRDFSYGFAICNLQRFKEKMLREEAATDGTNSGINWKFFLIKDKGRYYVKGRHKTHRIYDIDFCSLEDIRENVMEEYSKLLPLSGDTANATERHPTTNSATMPTTLLPIELYPKDVNEFKRLLLQYKSANRKIVYNDGRVESEPWNANKFKETSDVMHNLRSYKKFRQGNWQRLGIKKVEVTINSKGKPAPYNCW